MQTSSRLMQRRSTYLLFAIRQPSTRYVLDYFSCSLID